MICPKCNKTIPDDSWYCDQCGEMLMFCPKCREPRKGKRCTQCGSLLVSGEELNNPFGSNAGAASNPQGDKPQTPPSNSWNQTQQPYQKASDPQTQNTWQREGNGDPWGSADPQPQGGTQRPQPQGGTQRPQPQGDPQRPGPQLAPTEPTRLVMADDPSKVVIIRQDGVIGRTTGDYVDIFGSCPYVSSRHGRFILHSSMRWLYCDTGSTNGTKINNVQLEPNKNYLLKKGQVIEIGFVKFKVE